MGRNQQLIAAAHYNSGPLPSAEQLIKYRDAHPDAPDRIIKMAENQAQHRQNMESKVVKWDATRATAGLVFAFIIVLCSIYCSWNLISIGKELSGVGLFGTTLGSVVASFIHGTKVRRSRESGN